MAGQIIARGERTWLVRVYHGIDPKTGKRSYQNHTIHGTKNDAQKFLNSALRDRDLGIHRGVESVTTSELFEEMLTDYRINDKDHEWAERVVRVHLQPFFGRMKAAAVGTAEVRAYIASRQENGAANATINRALA